MSWRRLHFGTETWRYRIGGQYTCILSPDGKRYNVRNAELNGNVYCHRRASIFEDARGRVWAGVLPSEVKRYIHLRLRLGPDSGVPSLPGGRKGDLEEAKEAVLAVLAPVFSGKSKLKRNLNA